MGASIEQEIRKLALINAAQYEGKANPGAVFGRAMGVIPDAKKDPKKTRELVDKIVSEVNKLSLENQAGEMKRLGAQVPKEEKEKPRTELPPLKGAVEEKIVTRFAPEPNGFMHFGHLKAAVMSNFYAKMYKGRAILRFDDTNPRKEKKEFYNAIKDDLDSLGFAWDMVTRTSEHMDDIYKHALALLEKGIFYVCTCPQEEIGKNRELSLDCNHRFQSVEENIALWNRMKRDLEEGAACVRVKIDMKHNNPVMRDPTMLRIVDFPHPFLGTACRVFPLYNFSTVICDHKLGVTHVFRDKGFENDSMIQDILYGHLGWAPPEAHQFGRLKTMAGIPLSKRKQKEMIDQGKLAGFEDMRIPTPRNFLKRGFLPQALIQVMIAIGPSKADIDVSEEMLESANRKILDSVAERYFFVAKPALMNIAGAREVIVRPALFPSMPDRGTREIKCSGSVYVSESDMGIIRSNREIRLKDLYNVEILAAEKPISARYSGAELKKLPIIQWVPFENNVNVKLVMPDGSIVDGFAEAGLRGTIVQFERVGFARVVKEGGVFTAYFAHL